MRTALIAAALALSACATATAQTPPEGAPQPQVNFRGPDLAAQRAAMDRIAIAVGNWTGEAEVSFPARRTVYQTERIERGMDGLLLVIHGHGSADAERSGTPIFNAFGVISYDDARQVYEFRVYNDGRAATAEARFLDDGRLQWVMDFSPVIIRYTVNFTADTWHEVGEMSRDGGATWTPTVEMSLTRAG